jgi:hypothetical protein
MTLRCAYCATPFRLTWTRYATAPLGRFTCESCGRAMRIESGWKYWALYVPALGVAMLSFAGAVLIAFAALLGVTPGAALLRVLDSGWLAPAAAALMLLTFAVDRAIDARYRRLVAAECR